jgi:hypothetical protein
VSFRNTGPGESVLPLCQVTTYGVPAVLHQVGAVEGQETRSIRELRPKLNAPLVWAGSGGRIWLFLSALALVAAWERSRTTFLWSLATCAAVTFLGVLVVAAYLWWARIELSGDVIRLRRLTGTRQLGRSEIWSVALRDVRSLNGGKRPVFVLYSRDHRSLANLDRRLWSEDTFEAVASWIGTALPAARTTDDSRLESEFTGSVSAVRRHGTLVAFAIVLVPIILVVLIKAG